MAAEEMKRLRAESEANQAEIKKATMQRRALAALKKIKNIGDPRLTLELIRALVWNLSYASSPDKVQVVNKAPQGELEETVLKTPEVYHGITGKFMLRTLYEYRWRKPLVPETFESFPEDRLKILLMGNSGRGKTTLFKRFLRILGWSRQKVKDLNLKTGDARESTIDPKVLNIDVPMSCLMPNAAGAEDQIVPLSLYDTPGWDGVKPPKKTDEGQNFGAEGDPAVFFAQKYGVAHFDAVILVIGNRFNDREQAMAEKLRPFNSTFIVRSRVDDAVNQQKISEWNDKNFSDIETAAEMFPLFREESMDYFESIGIKKVYFIEAYEEDSHTKWEFPELLADMAKQFVEKLSCGKADDPIERAVAAASVEEKDAKKRSNEVNKIMWIIDGK